MLKDKVALVTGASKGIGKAIALTLGKEGTKVVVNYARSTKSAQDIASKIGHAIAIKADVSKNEDVQAMLEKVKKQYGRVDILVNNAGIARDRTIKNMSVDEWQSVIDTNLSGVFFVTKATLPLMKEGGRIINISSIVASYGNIGQGNYAAAKAGIIGLTKTLAKELGKKKITVNAVCPGFIKTDMTEKIPFFKKKIIKFMTSLGEEGNPEDVADLVAFLASEKSRYMTGSVINIDGGLAF